MKYLTFKWFSIFFSLFLKNKTVLIVRSRFIFPFICNQFLRAGQNYLALSQWVEQMTDVSESWTVFMCFINFGKKQFCFYAMIIDFKLEILQFSSCVFLIIQLKKLHSSGVIPMVFIHLEGGVVWILFSIRITYNPTTFHQNIKVSEYDQEILQSLTADQLTPSWGRATAHL